MVSLMRCRGDLTHTRRERVVHCIIFIISYYVRERSVVRMCVCVFLMKSYDDSFSGTGPRRGSQGFDKNIRIHACVYNIYCIWPCSSTTSTQISTGGSRFIVLVKQIGSACIYYICFMSLCKTHSGDLSNNNNNYY